MNHPLNIFEPTLNRWKMKKILIPTDFSDNSKNAMRYAMELFNGTPCHFYLLYVNEEGTNYMEKPVYEFGTNILVKKVSKAIGQKLEGLKDYLKSISSKKDTHSFSAVQEEGYFLESIRNQIQEKQIDTIVMGTQGASELKEFFMGTRSGDVITKIECDVLVVPDKAEFKGFTQVVFPVDFELPYDDSTLKKIVNIVASEKAHIKLLYVTKSQIPLFEEVEIQQKRLVQRLSQMAPNPISIHRAISRKIEDGIRIFTERSNTDLIIMVSKDYSLLKKLFLDTTVEEVSFDTKIPLLSLQG